MGIIIYYSITHYGPILLPVYAFFNGVGILTTMMQTTRK